MADLGGPVLLAIAGIAMVIFAGPVYEYGQAAAVQLMQPGEYLSAVLQAATAEVTQ
jgi:formate hydrogenlyase subunit 3/multisubunit Na+/H+ antiporter MnhD subunit